MLLKERKKDLEICKKYSDKKGKLTTTVEKGGLQVIIEKEHAMQEKREKGVQ